ncbi:MAG: tRNA lysidine(34) synthetase TilS [Gammaproteobacteria bacterium]|nr:tRNA lysidine(34) synthetase TilS [Gammaproteobacteria bacterium]
MPISLAALLPTLPALKHIKRYWVAYSGGLDSHVLLHSLAAQRPLPGGAELRAVHVNHRLSGHAADWAQHCEAQCIALGVPLQQLIVDARAEPGESPEAAARHARYRAIAELVQAGDCLLTAHHQDDQAETLLLQLLRGAGPRGLAAMPMLAPFADGWHARPLLGTRRDELLAYAEKQGLHWVDDESNVDTGFDRNFLRHDIFPKLKQRFPAAASTLARSAGLCAEASELLDLRAQADLDGLESEEGTLSADGLRGLGEVRARNALYHWIRQHGKATPSAAQMARIWQDVLGSGADSQPLVIWAGVALRRYRDALFLGEAERMPEQPSTVQWPVGEGGCHDLRFAGLGVLSLGEGVAGTAALSLLRGPLTGHTLEVRFRQGGERLQPAGRRGRHALKKLWQEAGVPPWRRDQQPLIFLRGELIAVAGLCVAEGYAAEVGDESLWLTWKPEQPSG